ncbi:hypothetical protein H6F86_23720 [Phormidium sp. FACHB-592]|uniref:Uncharacterized protein n=1 Tax=Stenomitos frigidus AS-A4 TaxID=2933935 RepID=A0ABV0KWL0_9CYAN|nr:hypothetical protein [Phormidium sp. FACHB-592]MBD2076840.1 hypothetical protein [Phormidium sp. FACHB-592]
MPTIRGVMGGYMAIRMRFSSIRFLPFASKFLLKALISLAAALLGNSSITVQPTLDSKKHSLGDRCFEHRKSIDSWRTVNLFVDRAITAPAAVQVTKKVELVLCKAFKDYANLRLV